MPRIACRIEAGVPNRPNDVADGTYSTVEPVQHIATCRCHAVADCISDCVEPGRNDRAGCLQAADGRIGQKRCARGRKTPGASKSGRSYITRRHDGRGGQIDSCHAGRPSEG